MKFTSNVVELKKAVDTITAVIDRSNLIESLRSLYVEVKKKQMRIIGSNNEMWIKEVVNVEDTEDGSVLIAGEKLKAILASLKHEKVTVETNEKYDVSISSGKTNFVINGLDAELYSSFNDVFKKIEYSLPFKAETLKYLIEPCISTSSYDEYRPSLVGVVFRILGDKATAWASDSFRLSVRQVLLDEEDAEFDEMLAFIPPKSAKYIALCGEHLGLSFKRDKSDKLTHAVFNNDHLTIVVQLNLTKPVDTSMFFYTTFENSVVVDRQAIKNAIIRVSLLRDKAEPRLLLDIKEDTMRIVSYAAMDNEIAEETIECLSTREVKLVIKRDWLLDALNAFESDTLTIEFEYLNEAPHTKLPIIIKSSEDDGQLLSKSFVAVKKVDEEWFKREVKKVETVKKPAKITRR